MITALTVLETYRWSAWFVLQVLCAPSSDWGTKELEIALNILVWWITGE